MCEDLTLPFDSVNFHATDYVMQAILITKSLLENVSMVCGTQMMYIDSA
jgi:hypothetical protein